MRPITIAILAGSTAWPAVAQTPPAEGNPPPAAEAKLPLAAMRHAQPRRAEVDERERNRLGPRQTEQQKQQAGTVDRLYQEIMRRSAPAGGQ